VASPDRALQRISPVAGGAGPRGGCEGGADSASPAGGHRSHRQLWKLERAATGEGVQMAGKRHEGQPACGCDQAAVNCAALTVRQLSQERVRELAEEI
jgi:hypothetical protein